MTIDKWYQGEKIERIDCFFYPENGEYRGNLYNKSGKIIGDYSTKNSEEIEKRFSRVFSFGK